MVPLFSFLEIYIFVAVFVFALGALYANSNFSLLFFVFSINFPETVTHLTVIEDKFSAFFLNIRVVESHWGSSEGILSP